MPALVVDGLAERGHRVERACGPQPGWGPVSIIAVGADGLRSPAADPRVSTARAASG
jgi:gamma-glutamyltranspeptidase/glutathione hydrolase